jgi:Fic family protein
MRDQEWHPAVAAAWVHIALAAVHPFKDGNGRTARVLASLAMYRGGFRHPAFTSLEEWWGQHPRSYYEAFNCLGESFDPAADVTPFLKTHVRAQLSQVLVLALRQRTEGRLWTTLENLLDDLGLPNRLANVLYDSFFGREVTTGYYADLIDASQATARNDLMAATATRLLRGEGRTRGRKYLPGAQLMEALAAQLGNVEATSGAIMEELVRRSADTMQWIADSGQEVPGQQPLPGFDPTI